MKFKLDENLPIEVAALLSEAGHDAHTVLQEDMGGEPDSVISAVCRAENRILVTLDTDFCNILIYPPLDHAGIIVIRSLDQSKRSILNYTKQILVALTDEKVAGRLWIIQKDGIRIR